MIAPDEALQIVMSKIAPLGSETVAHGDALGRVLASDIVSETELPPFANSAMDGYALQSADVQSATSSALSTLRLLGTVAAGEAAKQEVTSGTCVKIMTGAPLPKGADAVVMREETREENGSVEILEAVSENQNIRPAGDDVARGERVLSRGARIDAAQWAMLASLGISQVEVFRRPHVGVLATGKELVDVDATLEDGQIRDSNSFALAALCKECDATYEVLRVGDEVSTLRVALEEMQSRCDLLVTSGGVSAGDFDPVRDALFEMQSEDLAQIHFWKIAMKPGKPVMFATLNSELETRNSKLLLALPGNPVSVMVSFELLARPALLAMQGRAAGRPRLQARVLDGFSSPAGRSEFVRALVFQKGGEWLAKIHGSQSSGRLSTMTRANALLEIDAQTTRVEAGDMVSATMTDWEYSQEVELLGNDEVRTIE